MLVFDWVDEDDAFQKYEQWVNWYDTKEELIEAYAKARDYWSEMIAIGRLHLIPAIEHTWEEIERDF